MCIRDRGKDDKKIYKGSTTAQLELSQNLYLNGVSCFVINDENKVLIAVSYTHLDVYKRQINN